MNSIDNIKNELFTIKTYISQLDSKTNLKYFITADPINEAKNIKLNL